jgi:hypothetical protein
MEDDQTGRAFVREPSPVGGFDCVGIEFMVMAAPLGLGFLFGGVSQAVGLG